MTSIPSKNMNVTDMAGDTRNSSSHFSFGSALLEFMAGKLGAPGCWPGETNCGRHTDLRALNRWENEGGRTLSPLALHATRPIPN